MMFAFYFAGILVLFSLSIVLSHWPKSKAYYDKEKKRIEEAYSMGEYLD